MTINQTIEQTHSNPQCDAAIKKLFGDPYIISILMKLALPESYGEDSIEFIKNHYVTHNIHIGQVPIHQDDKALLLNNEDKTLTEGTISFDVLTMIQSNHSMISLDIEGQNDSNPGYQLINRGIYYAGRLISRQKEDIWKRSEYDKMMKCVSIWICTDPIQSLRNTVECFELNSRNRVGTLKTEKDIYDKILIMMIRLGKDAYQHEDALIRFLGTLMTSQLGAKEKIDYLRNEFHIENEETKRMVNGMCNLSTGYYNEGFNEGRASGFCEGKASGFSEGKELGINEGMDSAIVDMIWHYAIKKGVTIKQSMEDLSIPEDKWNDYACKCEIKYGKLS